MRESDKTAIRTGTCPVCGVGCHVEVHISNGKVVRVKGDPKSFVPASCVRSGAALDYHDHPDRLNFPLRRSGTRGEGRWQRISWQEAIDEIAGKLGAIRDRYGPEAVLVLGGSPHGAGDPAAWRWCNLWGTPNYFHLGKNCGEAELPAEWAVYGELTVMSMPAPGVTKCTILWGCNPYESRGPLGWQPFLDAKKQGMKLIVVDPRLTASGREADLWLQLRPGTDGALAFGMLNVIISEGLYDRDFVDKWCLGFEELKGLVGRYPPEKVETITWVPAAKIVEAARTYATSKPALLTMGVANCHLGKAGLSSVLGKCLLRAVTGNLDVEGGNCFGDVPEYTAFLDELHWDKLIDHPLRTRDNVSVDIWPIGSVRALKLFREAMGKIYPKGCGPAHYMVEPGPSCVWTAMLEGKPYPIKAAFTQGTNTLCALANGKRICQAFKSQNLDLHVAMDHFMTPTAQLADYVLPATDGLERPDLQNPLGQLWGFTNTYSGRGQAVKPLYERRDDYQLWRDLGNKLGQKGYWPDTLEDWFDKLLEPAGIAFRELISRDIPWLFPLPQHKRYEARGFATFSGKVELVPSILEKLGYEPLPDYEEPAWSPISSPELAKEYPLILISGGRVRNYHHSAHRQLTKLRRRYPYPLLQIHPEMAKGLGISEGDPVYIETPVGRVRQKAQLVEGIHPQVVHADAYWWYPEQPGTDPCLFGVWDSNINSILPDDLEHSDYAGDNNLRGLLCRVYRAKEL